MGCAVSHQDSPMGTNQSKKKKRVSSSSKDNIRSNGKHDDADGDEKSHHHSSGAAAAASTSTIGKLQTQSANVSSSQANFFKMLDEKIENGIEFDEAAEEEERKRNMLRCVEEWDMVLGRSHEETEDEKIDFAASVTSNPTTAFDSIDKSSEDAFVSIVRPSHQNDENGFAFAGSVDSMRTMFSNSVTVPAGTFREAANEAEDSLSSPPLTSSVLSSSDKKSKYLIDVRPSSAAIGGRRKIRTPPDSSSSSGRGDGPDDEDVGYLNCSIRLSTVLQDREAAASAASSEAQSCK